MATMIESATSQGSCVTGIAAILSSPAKGSLGQKGGTSINQNGAGQRARNVSGRHVNRAPAATMRPRLVVQGLLCTQPSHESSLAQALLPILEQRRQQVGDDPARARLDLDRGRHAGREVDRAFLDIALGPFDGNP